MWNARLLMDKSLSGHKIGFVGLGNMGRAMARHLHQAGARVVVWNRSDAPAVFVGARSDPNDQEAASRSG